MKVRELIDKLDLMPPNADVEVRSVGGYCRIVGVDRMDGKVVVTVDRIGTIDDTEKA